MASWITPNSFSPYRRSRQGHPLGRRKRARLVAHLSCLEYSRIGQAEGADLLVVELAALLHDIADWKAHGGDSAVGPQVARSWLVSLGRRQHVVEHVCRIVAGISFKGSGVRQPELSLEGEVVQDADRLDAIGAIGIARAFRYGEPKGGSSMTPT